MEMLSCGSTDFPLTRMAGSRYHIPSYFIVSFGILVPICADTDDTANLPPLDTWMTFQVRVSVQPSSSCSQVGHFSCADMGLPGRVCVLQNAIILWLHFLVLGHKASPPILAPDSGTFDKRQDIPFLSYQLNC